MEKSSSLSELVAKCHTLDETVTEAAKKAEEARRLREEREKLQLDLAFLRAEIELLRNDIKTILKLNGGDESRVVDLRQQLAKKVSELKELEAKCPPKLLKPRPSWQFW